MVRRIVNLAISAACVAAVLGCVPVGYMWWRSWRGENDYVRVIRGTRYTLRSSAGRLTLLHPPTAPAAQSPELRREVKRLVAQIRNDQLAWDVIGYQDREGDRSVFVIYASGYGSCLPGTPASDLWRRFTSAERDGALVAALDDPDRFAVAHFLLSQRSPRPGPFDPESIVWRRSPGQPATTPAHGTFNGIGIRLERTGEPRAVSRGQLTFARFRGLPDRGQMGAISDHWHRRLDVPVRLAAHWHVAAALAVLPVLWLAAGVRRAATRRRRRLGGLCVGCGYDLRGSSTGRCSECGAEMRVRAVTG